MTVELSEDFGRWVHEKLASGLYKSVDQVLSAARLALDAEEQTIVAVSEGYEDFKAGRFEPWEEADAEFRKKHGLPTR